MSAGSGPDDDPMAVGVGCGRGIEDSDETLRLRADPLR
jgi:hypothetical protein